MKVGAVTRDLHKQSIPCIGSEYHVALIGLELATALLHLRPLAKIWPLSLTHQKQFSPDATINFNHYWYSLVA